MQIHSLTIDHFKAIDHLELTGLPDTGVIVISGDNEQGKSTILEALRFALEVKHSSRTAKDVKQVTGDESPRVELEMTIGPYRLRLAKQWLKGKKEELTVEQPAFERFTGDEAHNKLTEILNRYTDKNLRNALLVQQNKVDASIAAAGIEPVSAALKRRAAGADATIEDSQLLDAAAKELDRYYNTRGEKGELKAARAEHQRASEAAEDARRRAAALATGVAEVERARTLHAEAVAALPEAGERLREATAELTAATEAAQRLGEAENRVTLAETNHNLATTRLAERVALNEDLAVARDEAEAAQVRVEKAKEAETGEAALLEAAEASAREAAEVEEQAEKTRDAARIRHSQLVDAARAAELAETIADARDVAERLATLRAKKVAAVGDEDVERVEELEMAVRVQAELRHLRAAKLELTGDGEVSVDGHSVELPSTVELADGTAIGIGGVTAVYRAGEGAAGGEEAWRAAREELAAVLDALGVADAGAVRDARDAARHHKERVAAVMRESDAVLGGRTLAELEAEAAELAARDIPMTGASEEEIASASAERVRAEEAYGLAHEQAVKAVAKVEPLRGRPLQVRRVEAEAFAAAAQEKVARLAARLQAAAGDAAGEEALHAELEQAAAELEAAKLALDAAQAGARERDVAVATQRAESEGAQVQSWENQRTSAEKQLASLQSVITSYGAVSDELARAEDALEVADRRLESVERRAHAARTLFDTLTRHRTAARERYAAPFAAQLEGFAKAVFGPEVSFSLGEDLTVQSRRIGDAQVAVNQLSGGAQEQLALVTRFAIAALVGAPAAGEASSSAAGSPATPVFIDDALGNTDSGRLLRMAGLFNQVGRTTQVFVLTCVPQRYGGIPGAHVYPIAELKSGG